MRTELMSKAIVALFTDMPSAQKAIENLEMNNFNRADINLFQRDEDIENLSDIAMLNLDSDEINDLQNGFKTSHVILTIKPTNKHHEVLKVLNESNATTILTSHASYQDENVTTNEIYEEDRPNSEIVANRENLDYKLAEDLHEADNMTIRDANLTGNVVKPDLDIDQKIQLHEEKLDINKEQVQSGEVIIRKEVITENKTVEVPVTREEVVIERHSVPQHSTDPISSAIDKVEEVARIGVTEEKLNIEKIPVVKEIVNVKKAEVVEHKNISETLKHEEVNINENGNVIIHDDKKEI